MRDEASDSLPSLWDALFGRLPLGVCAEVASLSTLSGTAAADD